MLSLIYFHLRYWTFPSCLHLCVCLPTEKDNHCCLCCPLTDYCVCLSHYLFIFCCLYRNSVVMFTIEHIWTNWLCLVKVWSCLNLFSYPLTPFPPQHISLHFDPLSVCANCILTVWYWNALWLNETALVSGCICTGTRRTHLQPVYCNLPSTKSLV